MLYTQEIAQPVTNAIVIIPTYKERENIQAIIDAVLALPMDFHLLIVDDSSPDGTGEIVENLQKVYNIEEKRLHLLKRPGKQGLGTAYIAGFHYAIEKKYDYILEMDADFSHDPTDLPRLIAASRASDLVLGSRYVPGGGVTDWGLLLRLVSRGGSAYARLVLGVPVRYLTGGFKCFNRRVLEGIELDEVQANGYQFQIELTYRAARAGFTVTEVPILFRERRVGTSKMTPRIALEAVWRVPALRFRR